MQAAESFEEVGHGCVFHMELTLGLVWLPCQPTPLLLCTFRGRV